MCIHSPREIFSKQLWSANVFNKASISHSRSLFCLPLLRTTLMFISTSYFKREIAMHLCRWTRKRRVKWGWGQSTYLQPASQRHLPSEHLRVPLRPPKVGSIRLAEAVLNLDTIGRKQSAVGNWPIQIPVSCITQWTNYPAISCDYRIQAPDLTMTLVRMKHAGGPGFKTHLVRFLFVHSYSFICCCLWSRVVG